MPSYNFKCNECQEKITKVLSISVFQKFEKSQPKCPTCSDGILIQEIKSVRSQIDRSNREIIEEIKQEVQESVAKIYQGDEQEIRDVYGETLNTHKV